MLRMGIIKHLLGLTLLALMGFVSAMGQNRTVVLAQPPLLTADAGEDFEIIAGDSVQLGGNLSARDGYGSYLYTWTPNLGLDNPTSPNPFAKPEISTTYLLSVFDGKNCLAQDEVYVAVTPNSIGTFGLKELPKIYPNPSPGRIFISLPEYTDYEQINVISTLGKVLLRIDLKHTPNTLKELDLSQFGKGNFFITFQSANRHTIQKVWIY